MKTPSQSTNASTTSKLHNSRNLPHHKISHQIFKYEHSLALAIYREEIKLLLERKRNLALKYIWSENIILVIKVSMSTKKDYQHLQTKIQISIQPNTMHNWIKMIFH